MVSRHSSVLPVYGREHSYEIRHTDNAKLALEQAEKHYNIVKRKQCISDYNSAVKDLDVMYDKLMVIDETTEKLEQTVNDLKVERNGLENLIDDAKNRLVLVKAKLQQLNVATGALLKPQIYMKSGTTQTQTHTTSVSAAGVGPILSIPDDEQDAAIKSILQEKEFEQVVDLTSDSSEVGQQNVPTSTPLNVANTVIPAVIIDETQSNIVMTTQNVTPTPQNVVQMPQNVAQMPQNVVQLQDILQGAMAGANVQQPMTFMKVMEAGQEVWKPISQPKQSVLSKAKELLTQKNISEASGTVTPSKESPAKSQLPEGFRKTKYADTLEKINPQPEGEKQKAGKRFFCARCMTNEIFTGYTKRFDLQKHLVRCGTDIDDKPFKCEGYDNCERKFARVENLRQHVASDHTKELLYKCKKCGKGFSRSSEASGHRKNCYQEKEDPENAEEDT